MNEIYTTVSVGLLLSWLAAALLRIALPGKQASLGGLVLGLAIMLAARSTLPVLVLVSLFEPVAFGLSFLILRSLAKPFLEIKVVPAWEQVLFLGLIFGYLYLSAGVTLFDPYRLGFDPLWAGCVAGSLCLYAGMRGYIGFSLLPFAAQIIWMTGLGSSNYFDHLISALMVPILIASVFGRLLATIALRE